MILLKIAKGHCSNPTWNYPPLVSGHWPVWCHERERSTPQPGWTDPDVCTAIRNGILWSKSNLSARYHRNPRRNRRKIDRIKRQPERPHTRFAGKKEHWNERRAIFAECVASCKIQYGRGTESWIQGDLDNIRCLDDLRSWEHLRYGRGLEKRIDSSEYCWIGSWSPDMPSFVPSNQRYYFGREDAWKDCNANLLIIKAHTELYWMKHTTKICCLMQFHRLRLHPTRHRRIWLWWDFRDDRRRIRRLSAFGKYLLILPMCVSNLTHHHSHSKLTNTGYICPRCASKVCELPSDCDVCGLTLVSSPHLARSYHHLFPVHNFEEIRSR